MLGNGCNMSCKYCLQHPLVHHQLTGSIDPVIYDFIREVKEENGDESLRLQFYGGEPLLYFENIKEIVERTKYLGIGYSIITNGRAMTDKMVDFFNENEFSVTISWDGPHVLETRGFDSFSLENPALRRRLLRIERLGLSAVLSAKAYPKEVLEAFQEISDQYYKLHKYGVYLNCDEIFDTGLPDKSLLDVDYARARQEMAEMTKSYIQSFINKDQKKEDYTKNAFIQSMHNTLKGYCEANGKVSMELASCGNGFRVLNMDLSGNLYPCHNTSESIGHINDNYFDYFRKVLKGDQTRFRKESCKDCIAVPFCRGGCKLVSEKAREESYCHMKRAIFGGVMDAFLKYGAELEAENGG